MRRIIVLVVCSLCILALQAESEKLYLRDGSVLMGKLTGVKSDSLFFITSFGARMVIERAKALRIDFSDSLIVSNRNVTNDKVLSSSEQPGSLHVVFDSRGYSSKILVHRDRDTAASLKANSIEEALFIDNQKVFSFTDTVMDKIERNGPDKVYKNSIDLKDIKIQLRAGPHRCKIVVRNLGAIEHKDNFENKPLFEEFEIGDLVIYPGKLTQIQANVKKKKWVFGGGESGAKH
jgi:hypothetical protein